MALGASKYTAALTSFKASYMANHLASHVPSTVLSIRPTFDLRPQRLCPHPIQVHLRPRRLCLRPSQVHLRPRRLYLRPRQVNLRPRRLYVRPRQLYLRRRRFVYKQDFISTVASLLGFGLRRFCSLSLCPAFAVSTHVVFLSRANNSVYCDFSLNE